MSPPLIHPQPSLRFNVPRRHICWQVVLHSKGGNRWILAELSQLRDGGIPGPVSEQTFYQSPPLQFYRHIDLKSNTNKIFM